MARDRRLAGDRWRFPPSGSRFRYHHNDVSRSIFLAHVSWACLAGGLSFHFELPERRGKAGSVQLAHRAFPAALQHPLEVALYQPECRGVISVSK